jgi:hypothetical protein
LAVDLVRVPADFGMVVQWTLVGLVGMREQDQVVTVAAANSPILFLLSLTWWKGPSWHGGGCQQSYSASAFRKWVERTKSARWRQQTVQVRGSCRLNGSFGSMGAVCHKWMPARELRCWLKWKLVMLAQWELCAATWNGCWLKRSLRLMGAQRERALTGLQCWLKWELVILALWEL